MKSCTATKYPSSFTVMGSCGSGRVAGPNTGRAYSVMRNCDWWQGHSARWVCCSYSDAGQPRWVQTFEKAQ